jgi:hypothetical protein
MVMFHAGRRKRKKKKSIEELLRAFLCCSAVSIVMVLGLTAAVEAELIDRGGGLIYDAD